MKVMLH